MVKISSDLKNLNWRTRRHVVYSHVGRVRKITSSRGPDQKLQRRQRVYRRLGVQQALVLFQIKSEIVVYYISVEKYYF
jgi:hypothetical protein